MRQSPGFPLRPAVAAMLAVAVVLAVTAVLWPRLERYYLGRAAQADEATRQLVTEVLRGALERTEALPALIAERPILTQLLRAPSASGIVPFANEQLRLSALSLDVSDIYVMDLDGTTVAASNYRSDHSFVGRNFAFRPYFSDALAVGRGRFHALGTTSGERGYYFAAPVIAATEVLGVVAVKVTLDRFERTWAQSDSVVAVYDSAGVVFLSDRKDWHFRTIGPVSEPAIDRIAETRQYPLDRISGLPLRRAPIGDGLRRAVLDGPGGREAFVMQEGLIAAAGWRVAVFTPAAPASAQAAATMGIAALLMLLAALVAAVFAQRRARLLERLATQQSQQTALEARVRERTRDLNDANRRLPREVDDRRAAEARLRRTQAELVQAGKLAALGQMSAALSHEFNQPLNAVKSYAENAVTFLDRARTDAARENIVRISRMADRMAAISQHLRNFARRPQDRTGPVPLLAVVDDALELMQPQIDRAGARVRRVAWPTQAVWVTGGRVRLQQVLVNLLANALDAQRHATVPRIDLRLDRDGDTVTLSVRDGGPGLGREALEQAFDPFFTTKDVGEGLGLGLSISYNIVRDFGGRLTAANHPDGGAVFTIALQATTETEQAAE